MLLMDTDQAGTEWLLASTVIELWGSITLDWTRS